MIASRRGPWRVLRNSNFRRLWLGQMISFVGDYFYFLAIPLTVERLTGSALMVGLSVISSALPMLVLGPIAGVFVDRWNRQKTMIAADVLRGLLVLLCLLVQTREMVWIFYVVGFLMSCVSRFFYPAQNALLPRVVGDAEDLLAANGLMQVVQMVGIIIGPALAGFSIGLWGAPVAFIADSVSFFVSALFISRMYVVHHRLETADQERRVAGVLQELRAGLDFLFRSPTMVVVLICLAVVQLGTGAMNVIAVPFFRRTFGVGAEGLGIVDAAQGVGMVLGGLALGLLAARLRNAVLIGGGLVLIGLFIVGMGLAPAFFFTIICCFGLGLFLTPASSALSTVLQLTVPDEKRGRVGGAVNAIATAAGLVSMAAASLIAETIGLRTVYVICGVLVGLAGLVALRIPEPAPAGPSPALPAEKPLPETAPQSKVEIDLGGAV